MKLYGKANKASNFTVEKIHILTELKNNGSSPYDLLLQTMNSLKNSFESFW